ncbi:hypothetical protein [Paenibacillus melissococcoides]|uniref:hypothetical protein n=1 Tax=Paenibacillus melissococcoides TaxID=2912268 RepID=UPI0038B36704
MNRTNLTRTESIARFHTFLGHVTLPVPIRPAAIVAGLDELEVQEALKSNPFFVVYNREIMDRKEWLNMQQANTDVQEMSIIDADRQYREHGQVVVFHNGEPTETYYEEELIAL